MNAREVATVQGIVRHQLSPAMLLLLLHHTQQQRS
jgi:hypothetical protein